MDPIILGKLMKTKGYEDVGYDEKVDIFENGALAVEYYFLLSGYFLSRSLEKIAKDEKNNII